MKFELRIDDFNWPGGAGAMGAHLRDVARRAERSGFATIWVWDHFVQLRRWEDPLLEGWLALAHMAAVTERVMLGTHVTGVTHRHPAVLVKEATTLDVLSGGRAYFGVGAGWNEREHAAFGIAFPPLRERFEVLEDTLRLALAAWSGETGPFDGRHIHLAEQIDSPPPVRRPHPPIVIGGLGERKTLRLVAQYAQGTDMFITDPAELRRKLDILRRHCEDVGRPYGEIEVHARVDLGGPNGQAAPEGELPPGDQLVERVAAMAAVGADHIVVSLPHLVETDVLERFGAEVIEPAAGIERSAGA